MWLKDRIIPLPGLLHQKCRSRCWDRSNRSHNPGAGTITPEVPLPLPGPEPLPKIYGQQQHRPQLGKGSGYETKTFHSYTAILFDMAFGEYNWD